MLLIFISACLLHFSRASDKMFEFNTYLYSEGKVSFKLATFDSYLTVGKYSKNIVICSANTLIDFTNDCFGFKTEMTDLYWLYNHTAFDEKIEISQWDNVSGMIVSEDSSESLLNLYNKRDGQLIIRIDPPLFNQLSS